LEEEYVFTQFMRKFFLPLFVASSLTAGVITFSPNSAGEIATVVAANPEGTQFVFQPGIYRNVQIVPRNNQVFTGQPGAVLNGSALITGFSQTGSMWFVQNVAAIGLPHGECDAKHPRCMYPQDLFFDDQPLRHVASLSEVTTGTWYFDFPNRTVYVGSNPTGRKVEIGASRVAFAGPAKDVTIE
jgi:hypothetical protein